MPLSGESVYVVVVAMREDEAFEHEVRVFSRRGDALRAWDDSLREVMVEDDLERLDDLEAYSRNDEAVHWLSPSGSYALMEEQEIE